MFFGGDQLKNNLGNNVIIKCHECGDTNLRYVDTSRTGTPGSGYICGNGHETWGSLDNTEEIFGQTDTVANNVKDCCCEGTSCNFPDQIYVNFEGIDGVQARESCRPFPNEELAARGSAVIGPPCPPNCTKTTDGVNGPWNVSCGCEFVSGPCQESTNGIFLPGSRLYFKNISEDPFTKIDEFAQYTVQVDIPATRTLDISSRVRTGTWFPAHPNIPSCPGCSMSITPSVLTPGFFDGGYPEGYRTSTPALITELNATAGNLWSNYGQSILFYIKQLGRIEYENDGTDWVCRCVSVKTTVSVIIRTHPAVNPTDGLPQFNFAEPSDEGIAEPSFTSVCAGCTYTEPSFDPGWGGPNVDKQFPTADDFCNLSNLQRACTNCNESFGEIIATNCTPDDYSSFWPYRIPRLYSAQINPTDHYGDPGGHQYFLRNINSMNNIPLSGDCPCTGGEPDFCYETVAYPKCLEVANVRCSDEDAKYRIPCRDPDDNFVVTVDSNPDDSVLKYRYNIGNLDYYTGFDSLINLNVSFEPIWISNNGEYDYWTYPPHPNPVCRNVSRPGLVQGYGHPQNIINGSWQDAVIPNPLTAIDGTPIYPIAYGPNGHTYGAVGVSNANMAVLLGDDRWKFEQPHCARRVKNPDLDSLGIPFYMVYTGDLSKQTIVMDRYYPTGDTYDFLWDGQKLAEDGDANQAFIKNRGDIGLSDNSAFPYPFMAQSGSLEEPEIVAIIHSTSGTGGQVAFQTFPVAYDSDILIDPYYYKNTDYMYPGLCNYKSRVTVHGYGVMYPLIDDPFWSETISTDLPTNYDPNNPPASPKKVYEYPVVIPGKDYEIGDKIEFRCWKTLEDSESRFDEKDGSSIPSGENEKIWNEECIETIIATATITELNDERLAPSLVDQTIDDAIISVNVINKNTNRYYESYQLQDVTISHTGIGYDVDDTIEIKFADSGTLSGIHYDTQPYVTITEIGESGVIKGISVTESGEFYKIVRTGGIRWYEFDEEDDHGNPLISIGNCPCSYDLCSDTDCDGCASRDIYPSHHNKLNSSPFKYDESITAKEIRTYFGEPWYKPYTQVPPEDAEGCATDDAIKDDDNQLINLICPTDGYDYNCGSSCNSRFGGVDCPDNCSCGNDGCVCYREAFSSYIGGWNNRNDFGYCWPINNTWEFPQYTQNYGRSACSGTPVDSGNRPYMDGHIVIPHKRPQYKYVWQPQPMAFIEAVDGIIPKNPLTTPPRDANFINRLKDEFLSIEGCNPLMLDRFGKSYKFIDPTGERAYGGSPCRKINSGEPMPSGVTRTNDDYCRVYGFYQQRQPSCDVVYRGQYIMRAAQKFGFGENLNLPGSSCDNPPLYTDGHSWTDCEPIIGDITIRLRQIESQFDLSFGAPYDQDLLIPEQLPEPIIGPDGKYEVTADPWNEPSLAGTDNPRFFNHGFYEPNRYGKVEDKVLPEGAADPLSVDQTETTTPVLLINPVFNMPDVDGGDFVADLNNEAIDLYNPVVWDLPDPRSNCRAGVSGVACDEECENPSYASGINLPESGIRNDLRSECPYPWERWGDDKSNTNDINYYCMFQNNSAEVVVDEIEECEECIGSRVVRNDYIQQTNDGSYPSFFWCTYREVLSSVSNGSQGTTTTELIFRIYGNFDSSDFSVTNAFVSVIQEYKQFFNDYYNYSQDFNLYGLLLNDDHRSIFWNMVFQGASNNALIGLTKVEIFAATLTTGGGYGGGYGGGGGLSSGAINKLFSEYRCDQHQRTGKIVSLKVQNGGNGYAFEIEERVPPTGILQNITDGVITIETTAKERKRRRETYAVSGVYIEHSGTGYSINDLVTISFNDSDYRRGQIFIDDAPTIKITGVDESGQITGWTIENSGEFYKYIGTDEHRAFPVTMVLNNYWDHIDGSQNFGRHAKLRPVIGVDKEDPKTYGRIKRVEVDFGGVDYIMPGKHWQIQTQTADYDQYGNPLRGLDIQHLVDPCKYKILTPNGVSASQVEEFLAWGNENQVGFLPSLDTPHRASYYSPQSDDQFTTGDPFATSVKHYLRTNANTSPIKWADKAEGWTTVIGSGSCPIESGNLLDRTYSMALIEENHLWNSLPSQGNCGTSECNNLIDESLCTDLFLVYPDNPNIPQCGGYCPVFSSYDAHRFNIAHTSNLAGAHFFDIYSDTAPYIPGCQKRIDPTYDQAKFFCYELLPNGAGGALKGKGFREYRHLNSSKDKCANAEYSNYIELGLYYNENTKDISALRNKTISYSMGSGPIKMKISYDKDTVEIYSGICPSGSWDELSIIESGLANICGCEENQ